MVTVDAVFDATIQVLLKDGPRRLTTTRVAERAGVSVGTLYQYYPHKQALLYAVLERHLGQVAQQVEAACNAHHHRPVETMVEALVTSFVAAKTAQVDEARALYMIAAELEASDLVGAASERMNVATSAMLATATDAIFDDLPTVSFIVRGAIVGPTRAVLEGNAPPKILRALRAQLVTLCSAYLARVARPRKRVSATANRDREVKKALETRAKTNGSKKPPAQSSRSS